MGSTLHVPARRAVRLTRRGRVTVTLLALVLVIAAGFCFGRVSSRADSPHPSRAAHTVTVHAGETLWEVAQRVAPHVDPRLVVAVLERANRLSGPLVEPGQQLVVPEAH